MNRDTAVTGKRAVGRATLHEGTQALWDALQRATGVRVHARSLQGGWNARGDGEVNVHVRSARRMIIEESGGWGTGTHAVRFRGTSSWIRLTTGTLTIEHVRRGETLPVRVAELVPAGRGVWRSRQPHICGRDRYDVCVKLRDGRVELRWRIEGPGKASVLRCTYLTQADAAGAEGGSHPHG
jgi:hypothetical protein